MTPPPAYKHDNAVSKLNRFLSHHLTKTSNKGTLYVPRAAIWTSRNTYLEPDLFYVSVETESQLEPNRRTTADLVVEVISPGSAIYDRNTKADTYAALGVKELWLIDENGQSVELRILNNNLYERTRLLEGDDIPVSTVLQDFSVRVKELFE